MYFLSDLDELTFLGESQEQLSSKHVKIPYSLC